MTAMLLAGLLLVTWQATPPAASSPYLDLVAQYQRGDYKQAVAALSTWPEDSLPQRVLDDLTLTVIHTAAPSVDRFETLPAPKQRQVAAAWASLVPAAAVMHLEASRRLFERDQRSRALAHVNAARQLVDWPRWAYIEKALASEEITRTHARLRRDVYLVTAWILQTQVDMAELDAHLSRARDAIPGDAEILLASGSAEELKARVALVRPVEIRARRQDGWREAVRAEHYGKALSYYRQAIERDATLAEAHTRLGRVLYEQARLPAAREALTRARELTQGHPDDGQEMVVAYLASLVLAGVLDASGNADESLALYEEIVKRWPGCQSGHIGLSHAFEARGERPLALGALQPLWSDRASRMCQSDPWWLYDFGQAWRLDARFATLREQVKP